MRLSLQQGYLKRCLEYNTLFDEERIEVIFSNVDKLYDFQKDFLRELEARIKPGHMAEAEIGEVFVINVSSSAGSGPYIISNCWSTVAVHTRECTLNSGVATEVTIL